MSHTGIEPAPPPDYPRKVAICLTTNGIPQITPSGGSSWWEHQPFKIEHANGLLRADVDVKALIRHDRDMQEEEASSHLRLSWGDSHSTDTFRAPFSTLGLE